jgi:dsRNA-specific ribonuclease
MSQQLNELEQHIGYHFHNRGYLLCALACHSAINERHPDAIEQDFQVLEFVGDAALKCAIATLLFVEKHGLGSGKQFHDKVVPLITNSYLCQVGKDLNLSKYIIKGKGVSYPTDKMFADTVEAILGAIIIDQQYQGNASENVLFDVVARLWSIKRQQRSIIGSPVQNKKNSSCCKYFCCFLVMFICVVVFVYANL